MIASTLAQDPPTPQSRPTVGDTVSVVHRVALPQGTLVEARAPVDSTLATLMNPPTVTREGDSVRIGYTLSVWAPGTHQLVIPGAVTVAADGTVDTLPDAVVTLDVASVLPTGAEIDSLTPRAARPWIERAEPSGWPFVVVLVPLLVLLAAAGWFWRRRGRAVAVIAAGRVEIDHRGRLQRLIDSGESALAVDHLLTLLPDTEAAHAWREEVAAVRFDPAGRDRLVGLVEEGLTLYEQGDTKQ